MKYLALLAVLFCGCQRKVSGIKADAQFREGVSFIRESSVVVCFTCNFSVADERKIAFGTKDNRIVAPVTVIKTVHSKTMASLEERPLESCFNVCNFVWGTDDNVALTEGNTKH